MANGNIQKVSPQRPFEFRVKPKTRLDAILTTQPNWTDDPQVDSEVLAAKYSTSAAMTLMFGQTPVREANGFRFIPSRRSPPSLREVVTSYILRIPGNATFAVCDSNVELQGGFDKVMQIADQYQLGTSWGAYSYVPNAPIGEPPSLFVLSAPNLPYLLRDLTKEVQLGGVEWREWMKEWIVKFVRNTRLFDITCDNVILPFVSRPDEVIEPVVEEEPKVVKHRKKHRKSDRK